MLEACVDIASHIIADKELRAPKSYSDTFLVLGEADIIVSNVSETMQEMAKFRNIIVHGYDKLDESIMVNVLSDHLTDFVAYRDAIISFLQQEE